MFSILHYTDQQFIQYSVCKLTGFNLIGNYLATHAVVRFYWRWKIATQFDPALAVSSFLEKPLLRKRKLYIDCCFPAQFYLCTDAVYFIEQYRGKTKYAVYPLYTLYLSSGVFIIPEEAGLRKEMSGKNWAVIPKKVHR